MRYSFHFRCWTSWSLWNCMYSITMLLSFVHFDPDYKAGVQLERVLSWFLPTIGINRATATIKEISKHFGISSASRFRGDGEEEGLWWCKNAEEGQPSGDDNSHFTADGEAMPNEDETAQYWNWKNPVNGEVEYKVGANTEEEHSRFKSWWVWNELRGQAQDCFF